ncbi:CoA-transferase [Clostridium sp. YIM B02555]|uniref:acyl CoA:acetate/3-ketoacid CoA transferase n=1 Tax=Clostridium sp. YIM B02555 TaxID=2911968 RepID=UPI001EED9EE3|nr:CoA-transferase [Clostridium sp. YIM B02555]
MKKPTKIEKKVPILTAEEAVSYINDGNTLAICGAGGGIIEATELISALRKRFLETESPKNLTLWHSSGLGDRGERGMSPLAIEGMVKRAIGGHWAQSPRLADMAQNNLIEAYNFPQGVMSQLSRSIASGHPGILTHVGLGTFIDPRQDGGKLNERTTEDLIKLMEINGREYLFYPSIPLDVCFIRGTTADAEGYISLEDEICYMDVLSTAQAVHNSGGIVIAQVKRVVKEGTIHPKKVKIPGYLVDALVVVPDQNQMYNGSDRFLSGDYIAVTGESEPIKLDQRKVVARRALMEILPGNVGNVGVGIADGIGVVAKEEGVDKEFTLTVETGPVGGTTAQGIFFGASINAQAVMDMPAQFDFYGGGGLDVAFLSFAEVDMNGNVNVHKFNGKIVGTGGFIDICQNSKKVVFCGTLRAGGLKTSIGEGKMIIEQEGKFEKMLAKLTDITFNGLDAVKRGQEVVFITERAIFHLEERGLVLTEVAPGIDMEKDIIEQMGFKPIISENLKEIDKKIFIDTPMNIRDEFINR